MGDYGYSPSGGTPDYARTGASDGSVYVRNNTFYVPNRLTKHVWFHKASGRLGRFDAGSPTVTFLVGSTTSGNNPDEILAKTNDFTAGTLMDYGGGGAIYSRDLQSILQGWSGKSYALGHNARNERMGFGMILPEDISGEQNGLWYLRSISGTGHMDIGDSISYSITEPDGWAAIWLTYEDNVAPDTPTNLSIASNTQLSTFTPLFEADFRDDNEAVGVFGVGSADKLNKVRIIVKRLSDNQLMWSTTYSASSGEKSARRSSKTYAGTSLAAYNGTDSTKYYYTIEHSDLFDAWSPASSARTFWVGSGLVVATSPTGKQETQSPGPFLGTWTHTTPLNAVKAWVRIKDTNGTVIRNMATHKVVSVANNGTITVTWADTGFAALDWGQKGTWEMKAEDSGGGQSPWSAGKSFNINAAPLIGTSFSPSVGSIWTSRPVIYGYSSDADDTTATGLQQIVRIMSQQNFLNPSFATDLSNWAQQVDDGFTETVTRDASVFQDAAGAIKFAITVAPAAPTGKFLVWGSSDYLTCVAGETYGFSGYVRKDHATDLSVGLNIDFFNSSDTYLASGTASYGPNTANTWDLVSVVGVAPTNAARMRIRVVIKNNITPLGGTRNAYGDNILPTGFQVRSYKNMTLNTGVTPNRWEYQTTNAADDVPSFAEYRFDMLVYDGTVYSGGSATAAAAAKSPQGSFIYASGPTVTVTAPADASTIATATPTITWTTTGQIKRRVRIFEGVDTSGPVIHSTGWITTGTTSYTVSSTLTEGGTLHHGHDYTIEVGVENATPLQGFGYTHVNLSYTLPETLELTINPIYGKWDYDPSVLQISWPETSYSVSDFLNYQLIRTPSADSINAYPWIPTNSEVMTENTSTSDTTYTDHRCLSGVEYEYRMVQSVRQGGDVLSSDPSVAIGSVNFQATVFCRGNDPDGYRMNLWARGERRVPRVMDKQVVSVWNRAEPDIYQGDTYYRVTTTEYLLVATDGIEAQAMLYDIDQLANPHPPYPLYIRNGRGHGYWGHITKFEEIDPPGGRIQRVSIEFTEVGIGE